MRFVLAACIAAVAGCSEPTGPEKEISGQQLYEQNCARCHGLDGAGVPDQPAANGRLSDPNIMKTKSDEALLGVMRMGKPPTMPGFADQFTEAKLMVILAYVKTLSKPERADGKGR